jgi:hypothetical protein
MLETSSFVKQEKWTNLDIVAPGDLLMWAKVDLLGSKNPRNPPCGARLRGQDYNVPIARGAFVISVVDDEILILTPENQSHSGVGFHWIKRSSMFHQTNSGRLNIYLPAIINIDDVEECKRFDAFIKRDLEKKLQYAPNSR